MTGLPRDAGPAVAPDRDRLLLRTTALPRFEAGRDRLRIVDLFSGCGGLTLGVALAAKQFGLGVDIRLAVDSETDATTVYKGLFPESNCVTATVEELFAPVGSSLTTIEEDLARSVGPVDLLIGGPPCQGHSDLNNHTRRDDPRNSLYLSMARAAAVLRPAAILIENVPAVRLDAGGVVEATTAALKTLEYDVADRVVSLNEVGVPQSRRRHLLVASASPVVRAEGLLPGKSPHLSIPTVRWAIEDLLTAPEGGLLDEPSRLSHTNSWRIRWLDLSGEVDLPNRLRPRCHRGEHAYKAMYGRLQWDRPAQTITTGFGSMGQGRYIHPQLPRTITPHEAARLQCLPDFVPLGLASSRGGVSRLIGNAVPPPVARAFAERYLTASLDKAVSAA